jgi:hypothetical protein
MQTAEITNKQKVLKHLQTIPGMGKAGALNLWQIGIRNKT